MTLLQKRITSAIAAGSLFVNLALPVLAGTTSLEISGNGRDTDNDTTVTVVNTTTVVQSNDADINNEVDIEASTGGNKATDNIGGEVSIDTGDVDVEVAVENAVNSNYADVDGCCDQDLDVLISGNAKGSDNEVELSSTTYTGVFQDNNADVNNEVDVDAETGDNEANDNLGGNVSITTGDVDVDKITILNALNSNSARVSGNGGLTLSARIIGNGRNTDNDIKLGVARLITLVQDNDADVNNEVDVDAETGDNEANDNLGGEVEIDTGDVHVGVMVDTLANFNAANVECDCLGDVWAKIANNLRDSDNDIAAQLVADTSVFQDNCGRDGMIPVGSMGGGQHRPHHRAGCDWNNEVDIDADTGDNKAEDNGGDVDADPSIETGDFSAEVDLTSSGNSNVYGEDSGFDLDLPFGFSLNISLDLGDLLDMLGL